MLDGKL